MPLQTGNKITIFCKPYYAPKIFLWIYDITIKAKSKTNLTFVSNNRQENFLILMPENTNLLFYIWIRWYKKFHNMYHFHISN